MSNAPDNLQLINHRVERLEGNHSEIKEALRELTQAVQKLVVVDERQVQAAINMDRIAKTLDKAHARLDTVVADFSRALEKAKDEQANAFKALELRVDTLEREAPMQRQASQWVSAAVYGAAGLAAMFVAKQVGLI